MRRWRLGSFVWPRAFPLRPFLLFVLASMVAMGSYCPGYVPVITTVLESLFHSRGTIAAIAKAIPCFWQGTLYFPCRLADYSSSSKILERWQHTWPSEREPNHATRGISFPTTQDWAFMIQMCVVVISSEAFLNVITDKRWVRPV